MPTSQSTMAAGNGTMTTATSSATGGSNGGGGSGGDAGRGQRTPVRPSAAVQTGGVDLGRGRASVSLISFAVWGFVF